MKRFVVSFFLLWVAVFDVRAEGVLHVSPDDALDEIGARLAADPSISEVVLAAGVYREGLLIRPLDDVEPAAHPLLIRPADGARVVFDGQRTITKTRRARDLPGVYYIKFEAPGGEPPGIWEPDARVRYTLAADLDSVRRFPATYAIGDGRLYFHTSDSLPPGDRVISISHGDYGLSIFRPHVTVRSLEFRNFVARGKWSAGVQLRADHGTIENCSVSNASFGFIVSGNHGAVVGCTARDVGGGVYINGEEVRVEDCRLFKRRDAFAIPTYLQDDMGVQFYHPARGGTVRRTLSVGFDRGILIKATRAPYLIEQNTLVGGGGRTGFLATEWHPDGVFRRNVVTGFEKPIWMPPAADRRGVELNCYSPPDHLDPESIKKGFILGDPRFTRPSAEDYRLGPESECRALERPNEPIGALSAAGPDSPLRDRPRDWHVSPTGRDGSAGTEAAPVRTVQFAVDRSGPGDTILLHPGIYTDPIRISAGGTADRPLKLRAVKKWEAILDSGRRAGVMIDIDGAPFVEIRDLEIRWYRRIGIRVNGSPDVTVSGCRIWNAHWRGTWPSGVAIKVDRSPRFVGDHNVLFRQERGFMLHSSPASKLTFNTCIANLYGAATFIHSIEGSVCRNNSFAFQGNDVLVIIADQDEAADLHTFDCDHNNYGTHVRDQPDGIAFDRVVPRDSDRRILGQSKAIVRYHDQRDDLHRFLTMREWSEFSSLDANSIFADPLYVSTVERDFRLLPSSPNIGAGENGTTIGAHE